MKVAVTGAGGRVAPLLIRELSIGGHKVIPYSRTASGAIRSLGAFDGDVDCVVHCAWSRLPFEAEADPDHFARVDLPLLRRILDATQASGARVVFLSSGAVYGNTGPESVDETRPPAPLGIYARGKLAAESCLAKLAPERSLILRTTNLLFSAGRNTDRPQGVLPKLVTAAKEGRNFELWGDGTAVKDYIHQQDFLSAFTALLNSHARGIFNVGSGTSLSLQEILAIVETTTGLRVPVVRRPHFDWDVSQSHISVKKLMATTGWSAEMSSEEAVLQSVREWA